MDLGTLVLGAIVGAIITLPIAIFGNIVTPWVKSYLKKSSLTWREQRVNLLIDEYQRIESYKNNNMLFVIRSIRLLATALIGFVILIDWLVLIGSGVAYLILNGTFLADLSEIRIAGIILIAITGIPASIAPASLSLILEDAKNMLFLRNYKEKAIAKIKKLGGNPEDLDKEELELVGEPRNTEKKSRKAKAGG